SVALCLPHRRPPSSTLFPYTTLFRSNPGAQLLGTDVATTALTKTEVLTAAEYSEGIISVPINWTKADEVKNSSENAKIKLVTALITNALESHDDLLEEALMATSTNGFLGFQSIVPDSGEGTVGGIDASVETWWRNYTSTYRDDGSDIQAQMTKAWRSEEHTSELQSRENLVCRLLLEK